MANPNIVNVTTIYGNTSSYLISSTADPFATALVNNPASSGKIFKINSIVVANVDGSAAADVTIKIFSQDDLGGTGTAIASTISVPADASLIVTDKSTAFYLLEDKSIGATASAANDLVVTCSWEEINS
jgi:DNA/RNA endonuclease YhcR with UshA esterase domain